MYDRRCTIAGFDQIYKPYTSLWILDVYVHILYINGCSGIKPMRGGDFTA